MYRAKAILKDKYGDTVGAILIDENNIEYKVKTSDILESKNKGMCLENAIIDSKGFVRSKRGKLPIILMKDKKVNAIENREIQQANKLVKSNIIKLYHGTKDENLVPKYGIGKSNNGYGRGFYTTPDKELGKEWAYSDYTSGSKHYCYEFELDLTGLKILDLTKFSSLHWIAELFSNRSIDTSDISDGDTVLRLFIDNFKLDISSYDIIIGYRADDRYFQYAKAFLNGSLGLESIEKALRYGELGLQVFIKSSVAFRNLVKTNIEVVPDKYRNLYQKRTQRALNQYKEELRCNKNSLYQTRIIDILRRIENEK